MKPDYKNSNLEETFYGKIFLINALRELRDKAQADHPTDEVIQLLDRLGWLYDVGKVSVNARDWVKK